MRKVEDYVGESGDKKLRELFTGDIDSYFINASFIVYLERPWLERIRNKFKQENLQYINFDAIEKAYSANHDIGRWLAILGRHKWKRAVFSAKQFIDIANVFGDSATLYKFKASTVHSQYLKDAGGKFLDVNPLKRSRIDLRKLSCGMSGALEAVDNIAQNLPMNIRNMFLARFFISGKISADFMLKVAWMAVKYDNPGLITEFLPRRASVSLGNQELLEVLELRQRHNVQLDKIFKLDISEAKITPEDLRKFEELGVAESVLQGMGFNHGMIERTVMTGEQVAGALLQAAEAGVSPSFTGMDLSGADFASVIHEVKMMVARKKEAGREIEVPNPDSLLMMADYTGARISGEQARFVNNLREKVGLQHIDTSLTQVAKSLKGMVSGKMEKFAARAEAAEKGMARKMEGLAFGDDAIALGDIFNKKEE